MTGSASPRRVWTWARETTRLARQRVAPGAEIGRMFRWPGKRDDGGVVIRHCRFHELGFGALQKDPEWKGLEPVVVVQIKGLGVLGRVVVDVEWV